VQPPLPFGLLTIKQAHDRFGHNNEDTTREIGKHLGIKITQGKMIPCKGCTVAKAKQKNVPRVNITQVRATKFGERFYSDFSTVKQLEDGPMVTKPNWHMIVDEATRLKISAFYDTKKGMVEPTCELFYRWKMGGHSVMTVRQDNAGKNKLLQSRSDSAAWKLGIKYEYCSRHSSAEPPCRVGVCNHHQ
jgi:hypothetical protein